MRKPKNGATGIPARDRFQTPPYAVDIVLPYFTDTRLHVWEPAVGEGILMNTLVSKGYTVTGSDILQGVDYFDDEMVPDDYDVQITNPPYSIKYKWLTRAFELGKPFALLMPSDTLFAKKTQELAGKYGLLVLLPDRRINFKTPIKGWSQETSAQFHSSWFIGNTETAQRGANAIKIHRAWLPRYTFEELLIRTDNENPFKE